MKNTIMEIANHEHYVSLEVAKLLKEAGFDWKCNLYFSELNVSKEAGILDATTNKIYGVFDSTIPYIGNLTENDILRPTLDVAQRWLREVKDIDIYIFPTTNNKRGCVYEWGIKTFGRALWVEGQPYTNQYETYEEAQEAGIKKALEIILEKGE